MNSGKSHIDPLQQQLQDKFQDFNFDTDVDVSYILDKSNISSKVPNPGTSKYWIGGTGAASLIIIGVYIFNTTNPKSINVSKPITKPENTTIQNVTIEKEVNSELETTTIKLKPKSIKGKTYKSENANNTLHENKNSDKNIIIQQSPIIENNKEIYEEESSKSINFEDFIKEKSTKKPDSLQLFIKKK